MALDSLRGNWALWIALCLCLMAIVRLVVARYASSARGRLAVEVKRLNAARRARDAASRRVADAERKLAKLAERASAVKPRTIEEAELTLTDAKRLVAGANDQCMIAATRAGRIISEEFPPARQPQLRARYRLDEER